MWKTELHGFPIPGTGQLADRGDVPKTRFALGWHRDQKSPTFSPNPDVCGQFGNEDSDAQSISSKYYRSKKINAEFLKAKTRFLPQSSTDVLWNEFSSLQLSFQFKPQVPDKDSQFSEMPKKWQC